MKWKKKYNVDLKEIHELNLEGYSLPELSERYNIPRTTLNRYLADAGYQVQNNKYRTKVTKRKQQAKRTTFVCANAWKRALIRKHGHICMVTNCNYDKIVEAHHIKPCVDGGETSIENGILLCPNHHAEAHAGLLDSDLALLKRSELLESPAEGNQQPSLERNWVNPARVKEGSTTSSRAKAVMEPRAPRSRRKLKDEVLRDMI